MQIKKALSSVRLWVGTYQQAPVGDVQGALWKLGLINSLRIGKAPESYRIVISWDPAMTSKKTSNEHGIIVCAVGKPYYAEGEGSLIAGEDDKHGYVLEDLSGIYTPNEACEAVIDAYYRYNADRVVAETNQGGDMVESLLRIQDSEVSYTGITAEESKRGRAEPVSALYEQRRIHHVGNFEKLETEQTTWTGPPMPSPNRLDALVHGFSSLFELAKKAQKRNKYKPFVYAG